MDKEEELDDSWIYDEERKESRYDSFFMEDINYVNVMSLYLDDKNNITEIKREKCYLDNPNVLSKEEILKLIIKNRNLNSKKFKINLILKYYFNIEHEKIHKFNETPEDFNLLWKVNFIDDIYFGKTLKYFHDVNNIYLVFKENNIKNHTKKILFNQHKMSNPHTRKILKKEY